MKGVAWGTLPHYNFTTALNRTFDISATAETGHCVLVTGPSGVGKSTIVMTVLDMLVGTPDTWPEDELRYIYMDCDREAPGAITKNIAIDLNRKLGNPFVALATTFRKESELYAPMRVRANEHDLRESFRVQAALRRTRYLGLDAMENIVPRDGLAAEARFDSIKSLIRPHTKYEIGHEMTLIMAGHYGLLAYWHDNAQLARRVTEIPVLPYQKTAHDINHFEELLQRLSQLYPLHEGRTLREWNDVLFQLSAGSVGLLKNLLSNAMTEMRLDRKDSLDLKHIIRAAPPKGKLDAVKKDLDGFWEYIQTSATEEVVADALAREKSLYCGAEVKSARRKTTRIGRKAAPRDPVGVTS